MKQERTDAGFIAALRTLQFSHVELFFPIIAGMIVTRLPFCEVFYNLSMSHRMYAIFL